MDYMHASNAFGSAPPPLMGYASSNLLMDQGQGFYHQEVTPPNQDHPDFWHLVGLVSEAVLEVVCVSSLGYIAAKKGLFSARVQKDVANLNIYFFTPCLIFSKLAAQLTGEKLTELWIIPIILFVQTIISWASAEVGTRVLRINKIPQRNFVKAMAVFGNSNSLPLSLVISLSHTISGLHWDRIPDDNDDEVSARGILYLLIFSQLGQAVRWSWGMNTLLRPMSEYTPAERGEVSIDAEDERYEPYTDSPDEEGSSSSSTDDSTAKSLRKDKVNGTTTSDPDNVLIKTDEFANASAQDEQPDLQSNTHPVTRRQRSGYTQSSMDGIVELPDWKQKAWLKAKSSCQRGLNATRSAVNQTGKRAFTSLPPQLQKVLAKSWSVVYFVGARIAACLNVPLCAILVSVLVGGVPSIKAFFYTPGTFVNNTVTSAINQLAGVAVPLILFVLGGNLCKSTLPEEDLSNAEYRREKKHMLICSIICRMLIPVVLMAPFLAVIAKYAPVSILDDPIFIVVCFLLTGAPSALQLAQICQVNDVFVPVISQLLVHSYVIWIFPSTLVLVMLALEVVKWAA